MTDPTRPTPHDRPRADGDVRWLEETVVDRSRADQPRKFRQSSVLGAAMIAVGEILEPDKVTVDIEIQAEAPDDQSYDLPFAVGFGDLPEII